MLFRSVEENTLARRGAEILWDGVTKGDGSYINALGALTGNMAVQQVRAGLKAIYLSGWQVAGDANLSGHTYPDQSLYAVDSVPKVVKRINGAFQRADQIQWSEGKDDIDFFAPIVADAEAGFGGVLNAFELMKNMIQSGAAGVHFEDQLAAVKKCGHMGGKVLVPTNEACEKLIAALLIRNPEMLCFDNVGDGFTVLYEVPVMPQDTDLRSIAYVNADATGPHFHIQVRKASEYPPRANGALFT